MSKRKGLQAKACGSKQTTKKFREDNDIEQAKFSDDSTLQAGGSDQKTVAIIDCLYEDVLAKIFMWLPPQDLLQIEPVCKKWKQAVKISWFNFHCFSSNFENMEKILVRAGKSVRKVQICVPSSEYSNEVANPAEALSLTPNLKHLLMDLRNDKNALEKVIELNLWDKLKSLSLCFGERPCTDTLNALLSKCSQLVYLKLEGIEGYEIKRLPSTLKFIDGGCGQQDHLCFERLLEVVIRQNIAFEGLKLPWISNLSGVYEILSKTNFPHLKHLTIPLEANILPLVDEILKKMSQLVSLRTCNGLFNEWSFEKVLCKIVEHIKHLQCLYIISNSDVACDKHMIKLSNLDHLTHITLSFFCKSVVIELFEALVDKGKLQYFKTDVDLPIDSVCAALQKCEALTWVGCNSRRKVCAEMLLRTVTEVFEKRKHQTSPTDPHIRHFYFGHLGWVGEPKHLWAIFHTSASEFRWNKFSDYNVFSKKIGYRGGIYVDTEDPKFK